MLLIAILENSRLDPNDPRNAKLLHLIDSIPSSSDLIQYFRLENVDDVQRYISEDYFSMDKRLTMLCLRDNGVCDLYLLCVISITYFVLKHHGLKNKVVPLSSKSISGSVWKRMLENKPYEDCDLPLLILGDFYTSRKEEQNKFLLDVIVYILPF